MPLELRHDNNATCDEEREREEEEEWRFLVRNTLFVCVPDDKNQDCDTRIISL